MNLGNRHAQHSFAQVPNTNTKMSKFDMSFAAKDTIFFDDLTPCFLQQVIPGDTINLNMKTFIRLAPQVRPIMDNMMINVFWFFVPDRIVWDNFEKFMGARTNPADSVDYILPRMTIPSGGFAFQSLADHFGLPPGVQFPSDEQISALPFRGYNMIYNQWFRDQNLQNSIPEHKTDGPDVITDYTIRKRAKVHDYFTSALPTPQKGPAVTLPLTGNAPVYGVMTDSVPPNQIRGHLWQGSQLNSPYDHAAFNVHRGDISGNPALIANNNAGGTGTLESVALGRQIDYEIRAGQGYNPPYADLSEVTSASINAFRQAIMMQSFLELDNRGGTRFPEVIRAHFNVSVPDYRIQIPEFLSSGQININQHPIAQTSNTTEESPQGNLAAFSTASEMGSRLGFSKSFVEPGYVIGLIQARGEVTYQQGIDRHWSQKTRVDRYWPKFQELGEQTILVKELYASTTKEINDKVFGYQERFGEYRQRKSEIRGQFRSTYPESLDVWHLAEEYASEPALNGTWIQSSTPIERALIVTEGYPDLLCDFWFDMKMSRPMVTRPVPATLGRF